MYLLSFRDIKDFIRHLYTTIVYIRKSEHYAKMGKHCIVQPNSTLVPQFMYLDDYTIIQDQTNFISNKGKLIVKKYSVISSGCIIVPNSHQLTVGIPFYLSTRNHINDRNEGIIVEEDCWVGAGCILLPGCHIGRGAVIGAGSVVKNDIPPYAVAVGTPAKIIAAKFSVEQILEHESILYPVEERLSKNEIEMLFTKYYYGMKSIGTNTLSVKEKELLEEARKSIGLKDYSCQ